ncbi:transketolase [Herbaspirillum sp. RTI4]|uniref:transketolase n=1 Tax=Herbaspirillum sp. RTI4 TaxID=3048640 RepID=UPI002AB45958|nr:transketolase [Herbaspirillum sp. RTI4]MDY7579407.1 transketolase [Herbaspirillum sp. RTI4]MEA9980321.1 transketolase [Herbaspirillum sp. RTI4]
MVVAPSAASAMPFVPLSVDQLREMARINRIDCTDMYMAAGNGHFGSSFSCAEILTALYFSVMRVDPDNPEWADRDRHIFSKGHAAPTVYSALIRRGFMPAQWMQEFETKVGVRLMTHPSRRYQPGLDLSTGALGHGLSVGVGMALAAKMDRKDYRVFVLMGDGEIHEGSVWEAGASAAKYKLDNLVAIIDRNGLCVDGRAEDVMPMEPLKQRWEAFGWETFEVDGHDIPTLLKHLDVPRSGGSGKPRMLIAKTIKGKGVSFMEDVRGWHADVITPEQYACVMEELKEPLP